MRTTRLVPLLLATLALAGTLLAQTPGPPAPKAGNPVVFMATTEGDLEIELFRDTAPKTVANFIGLAMGTKEFTDPRSGKKVKRPFYDGLTFHRVLRGYIIQGGCPLGNGKGTPGYEFEDEIDAPRRLERGVIAMANRGPNTNGSQFFITLVDTPQLAGRQTVFGRVIKGMDAVDRIGKVPVGSRGRPLREVLIILVRVKAAAAGEWVLDREYMERAFAEATLEATLERLRKEGWVGTPEQLVALEAEAKRLAKQTADKMRFDLSVHPDGKFETHGMIEGQAFSVAGTWAQDGITVKFTRTRVAGMDKADPVTEVGFLEGDVLTLRKPGQMDGIRLIRK
jgi:peptidyl-prolyl cis-trans isomerase A (cyclophilin A)